MSDNQIKLEVKHIFESGANEARVIKLIADIVADISPLPTPHYPSRLDFFTAAALTGLLTYGLPYSDAANDCIDIAKTVILYLDKEVK